MFFDSFFPRRRKSRANLPLKHRTLLQVEALEERALLAAVTVNAGQIIRQVNDQVLGINLTNWDTSLNTPQTEQMVEAAGLKMFRFPGGSNSDTWHFNVGPSYNGQQTSPSMASFISSVGGVGLVTLNYGTGSPQEAAAFLAYLNGSVGNTTAIGFGEQWNATTSTWVQVDWKTAGYWAGLRAATPLAHNDGLNFLRIGRTASLGIHYFEVGNEIYGSWETDEHGLGGDTGKAHDPATYVAFAKKFASYAGQIDPTISIGEVTGSVSEDNNWTANVLQQDAALGFIPGFLSDHLYVQAPGSESDSYLLENTVSNPNGGGGSGSPDDWSVRAAAYRALLNQTLGGNAGKVELLATEFNSVYSNPGKQSTSLVNGLFLADSLGSILQSEYNAADFWDLRNGWDTTDNNSSSLYGWRQGGDYGILGSGSGPAPSTGTYIPYPTYFAEQLVSKIVHTGDTVVQATSNDPNLSVYSVKQTNGDLDLLVINKSATSDLTGQFQCIGFTPNSQAQVWQYGKTQDTAQSLTTNGQSALANFTATLSVSESQFSYLFPSYSMTVLDLTTNLTNTAVTASTGNATYGQPITFTATVTANTGTPVGSVKFYNSTAGAYLGTGALQSSVTGTTVWTYSTTPTQMGATGGNADAILADFTSSGALLSSSGTLAGGEKVNPRNLTVSGLTANNKVYDKTTGSTINTTNAQVVGIVPGDVIILRTNLAVATFVSPNVGNGLAVTVSGLTLGGTPALNYTLTQPTATANITPAFLTITATPNTKVYDGTTSALAVPLVSGLVAGDTATGLSEAYTDPNPGTGKTLVVNGYTVNDGNNGNNYTVTTIPNIMGVITPLVVTYHFGVSAPVTATLGNPVTFTVAALDQHNNPTTSNYTGTVHFSSTDSSAILPKDTSLTNGTGTFTATFNADGTQTITVNDTFAFGILGTSGLITVNSTASQFAVSVPSNITAGSAFLAKVTAEDSGGHTTPGYTGTVNITSSDGKAQLPPNATLNQGVGYFLVILETAVGSPWTVTAHDTANSLISGSSGAITVSPESASYFTVTAHDAVIQAGTPEAITVQAFDAFGNVATGYKGLVHFVSSDKQAVLPADAHLPGGAGTFNIVFNTPGSQTLAVADTVAATPPIVGISSSLMIQAPPAATVAPLTAKLAMITQIHRSRLVPNAYGWRMREVTLIDRLFAQFADEYE